MAGFTGTVSATSNGTPATDDVFVEIKAATATTFFLKRIEVTFPGATPDDQAVLVKVTKNTGAATFTSGTTFTLVPMRINGNAATSVCKIKNGTNAATVGTGSTSVKTIGQNTRGSYVWVAADQNEWIESPSAGYIEIVIQCGKASYVCNVDVEIEE